MWRPPADRHLFGYSLAFSPDGKTLATGSYSHIVRLWDVGSRTGMAALTSNDGEINSVAFSPDGKTLAAGTTTDGRCGTWLPTATARPSTPYGENARDLTRPPARTDGMVRLWDVTTGSRPAPP